MTIKLQEILKDSDYRLAQFKQPLLDDLERQIIEKKAKDKSVYKVECLIRGKQINVTPEEIVRQLYLRVLTHEYNYPVARIQLEYPVSFGVEKKCADIVITDKDRPDVPYIIVELKKPKLKQGKEQLKSYCNATGAPMGIWTNGDQISYYHRKDPNYFEDIPRIPHADQKLSDVLTERWTIADLIKNDKLLKERKSLKDLILEMEDEVLANAGVDVFEELFKLIFTKLFDEMESGRNRKRQLEFRNYGDTEFELKTKIQKLFEKARNRWEGVFTDNTKIDLTPSHLSICVSSLQDVKLFNSNLDVVDEAFEYLINKTSKGEKGQYFTPRYIIDMCVKMLNPQEDETMIDTAAGSCGFPVHTIFHVWKQILEDEGLPQSHLFTSEKKPARCEDYVHEKVFAIDFDEKAVRVGRTLNLIAGDGQTNVLHLNTLDYDRWNERTEKDTEWIDTYHEGWKRLKKMRKSNDDRCFQFDILMANPPFAGDIKETRILTKYDLAKSVLYSKISAEGISDYWDYSLKEPNFPEFLGIKGEQIIKMSDGTFRKAKLKQANTMGRDILFIERNLDFLRPGGRMAVVLPQGRFNNSSDKSIREYIADRCRILAVVGLHGNVFKPHTGTKTSVLFLQNWTDDKGICPRKADYPIFFATMQEPSKDNSGDKIYVKQENGEPLLDQHGHLIVKHDLFNHDGLTQDGIAEAFIEFAKKEKLSFFFDFDSFDEVNYCSLLEELEVSEVMLSELEFSGRIDSEYYRKQFLYFEKIVREKTYSELKNLASFLIGPFGSSFNTDNYISKGKYRYVRGQDVKPFILQDNENRYIPENDFSRLSKYSLKEKDILVSVVGTIGNACIVQLKDLPAIFSCKSTIIRTKKISSAYLVTYLNSNYGRSLLLRKERGAIQKGLNLDDLKTIIVPIFSAQFQDIIEKQFYIAQSKLEESKITYASAENLLLKTLGLTDFQPSTENVNIKSFKDSFLSSGRLDSEYYQLKYEKLESCIRNYKNGFCRIKDYFYQNRSDFKKDKIGFNYIEISDISVSTGKASFNFIEIQHLPDNAKIKLKKGDLLISKVRPNRGAVAIIDFDQEDLICSGAFTVLRENKNSPIRKETLQTLLRTQLLRELLLKYNCGTSYPVIKDEDILKLEIPIIDQEIQTQISEKIQTSFHLRQQSEHLLDLAKQAVETAIEKGEKEAEKLLTLHAPQ